MAMTFLVDTNVFLEILLGQANKERCKRFLQENSGQCGLSDFSLHSIGMIAFRGRREGHYRTFLQDMLPGLTLMHLDKTSYPALLAARQNFGFDFDDAYQFGLAQSSKVSLVTQDNDFKQLKGEIPVVFL